jgi:hypothetical protein
MGTFSCPASDSDEYHSLAVLVAECEVSKFFYLGKNGQAWVKNKTDATWDLLVTAKRGQMGDAK